MVEIVAALSSACTGDRIFGARPTEKRTIRPPVGVYVFPWTYTSTADATHTVQS